MTYTLVVDAITKVPHSVLRSDGWQIPFDPDNTDYQQFKKDLANGATLQDATGTPMTASEITTFLQGLK
ncbi:hypothetical protein [Caudoviricetes sp.]|nr:hypothetical protein [Caudoviricetes sp.]